MAISCFVPRAQSVVNYTLISASSRSASDATTPFQVDAFSSAGITVAATSVSGTLNVYVQKLLPDNSTYDDVASFSQWTTGTYTSTGVKTLNFVNGGNALNTDADASLTAGTIVTAHMGGWWRIKFVLGTNAVVNFGVFGDFQA